MNKIFKDVLFLQVLLLGIVFLNACPQSNNINDRKSPATNTTRTMSEPKEKKIEPSTDITKLSEAIKLDIKPNEAIWHSKTLGNSESRVPGPTDHLLIAVMKFSDKAEKEKFESGLEKHESATMGNVDVEEWFPVELKNSGKKIMGERFRANNFLKAPYSDGILIKVKDSDYYILKIYSM